MSDAFELRMYRDIYAPGAALTLPLKAAHRVIYVFSGAITVLGDKALSADDGLYAKSAMPVLAGPAGAVVWRYEIAAQDAAESLADGAQSDLLLSGPLTTIDVADAAEDWLLRLDSVAFPAGGCALRHTHRGPGIRCLVEGDIRIDAEGASHPFGVGAPWFEAGPDPVFAQAGDQPTRFVRVSVLPASLKGASSIRYVDPEDAARPKDQSYRGYIDQVIGRPSR
ncbi:MAG: hypothetical protein HOJ21_10430 [Alphaproteobacteria bacterium]|jgi:hypothetical protein|nr:hypothetical protein [Alphaproteobacteria bacterium]